MIFILLPHLKPKFTEMNKLAAKIYRVDPTYWNGSSIYFIDQVIEQHNATTSITQYRKIETNVTTKHFEISLFIHQARASKPTWYGLIHEIASNYADVKGIESKYPSFILFFHNENEIFVITGGAGYRAVESVLDSQFGFSVVERLIDTSLDDIRGLSQRVFLGVELAANRFFKADYVFNDEDSFGKYYRGLEVFINNNKLKSIGVETSKKKLLVKGELGFKIDTKISFEDMLDRITKISNLLKEKTEIELNPFKKLNNWQLKRVNKNGKTFLELLDQELCQDYYKDYELAIVKEIYHPRLIEYLKCSEVIVKHGKKEVSIPTYQAITPRLILGFLDIEKVHFPRFRELTEEIELFIVDEESGKKVHPSYLADWFHGEVTHSNNKFLKFENEWFRYSINFTLDLNNRLISTSERIDIYELKPWTSDFGTEGDYNLSHQESEDYIIGDKTFHKGIEVADLITWTEDQLIVIHVKNGFDRNLRVLQSQIINSAKIIAEFRAKGNSEELSVYYENLKVSTERNKSKIPDFESFKRIILKPDVRFVFAFATDSKNAEKTSVLEEIKSSRSTIAKISLLHSFYTIRNMSYNFSLAKIIKTNV